MRTPFASLRKFKCDGGFQRRARAKPAYQVTRPCLEMLEDRLVPAFHVWNAAGGNTNWSNPNNWQGDVAPVNGEAGDIQLLFPANALNFATMDDIPGLRVNEILFTGSGYAVQCPVGSFQDLYFQRSSTNSPPLIDDEVGGTSFSASINLKVVDPSEVPLMLQVDAGTFDCSAHIDLDGTGRVLKTGSGTLQMDNGCFAQQIDVKNGALAAGHSLGIFQFPALSLEQSTRLESADNDTYLEMPITLTGAVTFGGSNPISCFGSIGGPGTLIDADTATVQLNVANTYAGSTTISAGSMVLGEPAALPNKTALTVAGGATLFMNGLDVQVGSLAGSGLVSMDSGTLRTGSNNADTTWTGFIGDPNPAVPYVFASVVKEGAGAFTMNGVSNYYATEVEGGTLSVGNFRAIGNILNPGPLIMDDNTTLAAPAGGTLIIAPVVLDGAVTFAGSANLNLALGVAGPGSLTQTDTGTVIINSAAHQGTTTINAGTLLLLFANLPDRVSIGSSGTLSLDGPCSIGSLAGSGVVALNGHTLETGADNSDSVWTGAIGPFGDSGGLIKQGAGTFTMNGTSSYFGATEVQAGTLEVGSYLALGNIDAGNLLLDDGSTLTALSGVVSIFNPVILNGAVTFGGHSYLDIAVGISGSGSLTQTDTDTVATVSFGDFTGSITIDAGHFIFASASPLPGRVIVNALGTLDLESPSLSIGSLAGSGAVNLNGGTLSAGSDNTSTTWSGSIGPAGDSGGFTKLGSGELTFSGPNSYDGPTIVEGGTLGIATSKVPVLSNMTRVVLANFAQLIVDDFVAIGSLEGSAGSLVYLQGFGMKVGYNGLSTTFAGFISGSGFLDKEGLGTFTFSGHGTYTGETDVGGGTLREGRDDNFLSPVLLVSKGATFDLNGFVQVFNSVPTTFPGDGTIALGGGTLYVGAELPDVFTNCGASITGPGRLIKFGGITLVMLGNSSYTGMTTDTAGTLEIDGDQPSSPIDVGVGANLAGTGTVGALAVSGHVRPGGSGILSPVGDKPGTLTSAGDVTFLPGSSFAARFNGTTAGSGYDVLNADGRIDLGGAPTLQLALGFEPSVGDSFTILSAAGGITGAFAGLPDGTKFTIINATLQIHYTPTSVVIVTTASTFLVTNTADSGSGSLRQAILDANAHPGPDTIDFAIPGSGVQTIVVGSTTGLHLPDITDPVTIDGYSQPGASVNTLTYGDNAVLLIELDGSAAPLGSDGLTIAAGNSTVRGLVINKFPSDGIALWTNGGDQVEGNFIGTNATGTAALANAGRGVTINNSAGNTIGGATTPEARNVISSNKGYGVAISDSGAAGNVVEGNYIGLEADGASPLGNLGGGVLVAGAGNTIGGTTAGAGNVLGGVTNGDVGVFLASGFNLVAGNFFGTDSTGTHYSNAFTYDIEVGNGAEHNTIGGTAAGARNLIDAAAEGMIVYSDFTTIQGNYIGVDATGTQALGSQVGVGNQSSNDTILGNVISGNVRSGITLDATANVLVQGNLIGTNATGTAALPNGVGILIDDRATGNNIGGTNLSAGNVIAFNAGPGVQIGFSPTDSTTLDNAVRGNAIYANGGLGIDLGNDGVTLNHSGSVAGPNNFQNVPILAEAPLGTGTLVTGTLNSLPNTTYTLDFYANTSPDPSGYGQGRSYLGSTTVTSDGLGNSNFAVTFGVPFSQAQFITATATDPAGNTSEFSHVADLPLAATGKTIVAAEGIAFTGAVASFTDSDPNSELGDYTASIDWGDGTPLSNGIVTQSGSVFPVSGSHVYAEEGNYSVTVSIHDQGSSQATATSTATVVIVPPTAHISGPVNGVPGQPRTFTFSAVDASPTDQAAGFAYTIDWADGSPVQAISRTPGNGSGITVDHIYTKIGSFTVHLTATEDGGSNGTAGQGLTVQSIQMQGSSLAIGGTLSNDTINVTPADTAGNLNVTYNGASLGNFKPTGRILIYGQSGNDTIQLVSKKFSGTPYYVSVPAYIFGGGTGNETLSAAGSNANNVLIGGAGNNQITGGLGRDLLIAGLGSSKLFAGTGEDILIGGWTDYDLSSTAMTYERKLQALDAIMAEWGRIDVGSPTDPTGYMARVNDVLGPGAGGTSGGKNGPYFLNGTTVHSSGVSDTLFASGTQALDWLFASVIDVVKNKQNGDLVTTLT